MKLLTIGIPTYNRAEKLRKLLNIVLPQYKEYMNDVDLLISDNASKDNTEEVVKEFQEKSRTEIKYVKNQQNVGPDQNFLNILTIANSTYIHIVSDDDILLPGALSKEIAFLKRNQYMDFIFCNVGFFRGDFIDEEHCEYFWSSQKDNEITGSKRDFLDFVGIEITFLSALIFSKKGFLSIKNPSSFCKSNWLQSYIAFSSLRESKVIIGKIGTHTVAQFQDDGPINYDPYFTFGPSLKKLFKFASDYCGFDSKQLKKIFVKNAHKFFSYVSKDRIEGKKHFFKRFQPFFKATCMYPSMWLMYWICLIPGWAWKFIRRLYKKITGKKIAYSD